MKKQCQGSCIKCRGENLDYGAMEFFDNQVCYPFTCVCGAKGKEFYNLTYVETTG